MRTALMLVMLLPLCAAAAMARVEIASRGHGRTVILTQPGATPAELYAADELAHWLGEVTGAKLEVQHDATHAPDAAIIVGPGPLASSLFPGIAFERLGPEESVFRTHGKRLLLAGGRPRGTLYAVYHVLRDQVGIRWWTPWATHVPRRDTLILPDLNGTLKPAFEARDPFWYPAFDADWAARNGSNSQHSRIDERHGGKVIYKGFVHTFFPLVPPEKYFATHPEWYSLINGKRQADGAQLCTTNPELRDFMVERVKEWLRESPEASIVSVSQNDQAGPCQCPNCKAIDEREGSYSGTMIELVNYIADKIAPEFPNVAVDTLAYQYTRKAPKTVKPRPNVIVRLCSIECNFAAPLTDKSNARFAEDIRDWNRLTDRLYIWDYTTNFAHYVLPHPNYFVLGPNVRFFKEHGVRGVFEQGAYQSFGSEMSEMRAWVLAQLLRDPKLDDRKLIAEFLDGYYGKAARPIGQYLELMADAAKGVYMGCFSSPGAPFLRFEILSKAEKLWQQAEEAVKDDPDLLWRVRQGRLPVWYAWLVRWSQLRRECLRAGAAWPVPASRKALADEWLAVATGPGPEKWAPMTHLNEGGLTPAAFVARFREDPPDPVVTPASELPKRIARPAPPQDLAGISPAKCYDAQDSLARLYEDGVLSEVRADPAASDGLAVWMPGSHHEWAFQLPFDRLPARVRSGKWQVYVAVRVARAAVADPNALGFTAGIYDAGASASRGEVAVRVGQTPDGYKSYLLGTVEANKDLYVWVAPPANDAVQSVWVDRVYFVREG